jgi:hypothetical protein
MRKTLSVLLAVWALLGLAACSEPEPTSSGERLDLMIRVGGATNSITNSTLGRAVEAPGTGAIRLDNGRIFLLDANDTVAHSVDLEAVDAQSGGQLIRNVLSTWRIYIVGNIPAGSLAAVSELSSLSAIRNFEMDIATQHTAAVGSQGVALANAGGQAQPIDHVSGAPSARVNVALEPLVGRLELAALTAVDYVDESFTPARTYSITGFRVTGVFADNYYPHFTLSGGHAGSPFSQGMETDFTGIGDEGLWPAVAGTATAGGADVWAYNLPAAGAMPRLILRLDDITAEWSAPGGAPASGTVDLAGQTRFVTLVSYRHGSVSGAQITAFERGRIYDVGALRFGINNLGFTPNPAQADVEIEVAVEILDWTLTNMNHEL